MHYNAYNIFLQMLMNPCLGTAMARSQVYRFISMQQVTNSSTDSVIGMVNSVTDLALFLGGLAWGPPDTGLAGCHSVCPGVAE